MINPCYDGMFPDSSGRFLKQTLYVFLLNEIDVYSSVDQLIRSLFGTIHHSTY